MFLKSIVNTLQMSSSKINLFLEEPIQHRPTVMAENYKNIQ